MSASQDRAPNGLTITSLVRGDRDNVSAPLRTEPRPWINSYNFLPNGMRDIGGFAAPPPPTEPTALPPLSYFPAPGLIDATLLYNDSARHLHEALNPPISRDNFLATEKENIIAPPSPSSATDTPQISLARRSAEHQAALASLLLLSRDHANAASDALFAPWRRVLCAQYIAKHFRLGADRHEVHTFVPFAFDTPAQRQRRIRHFRCRRFAFALRNDEIDQQGVRFFMDASDEQVERYIFDMVEAYGGADVVNSHVREDNKFNEGGVVSWREAASTLQEVSENNGGAHPGSGVYSQETRRITGRKPVQILVTAEMDPLGEHEERERFLEGRGTRGGRRQRKQQRRQVMAAPAVRAPAGLMEENRRGPRSLENGSEEGLLGVSR